MGVCALVAFFAWRLSPGFFSSSTSRSKGTLLSAGLGYQPFCFLFPGPGEAQRIPPGIYPALAPMVGYLGDRAVQFWQEKYYRRAINIPALIFLGFLATVTIALPVGTGIFFKEWLMAAVGVSAMTGICAVLLWYLWRRNYVRTLFLLPAIFVFVFTLYSVHVLVPKLEYYKSPRSFCEAIATQLENGGQWAMCRFYRETYVYYTDSFCTVLDNEDDLQAFLNRPTLALVVMREKRYQTLNEVIKAKTNLVLKRQIGHRVMVLISNRKVQ